MGSSFVPLRNLFKQLGDLLEHAFGVLSAMHFLEFGGACPEAGDLAIQISEEVSKTWVRGGLVARELTRKAPSSIGACLNPYRVRASLLTKILLGPCFSRDALLRSLEICACPAKEHVHSVVWSMATRVG